MECNSCGYAKLVSNRSKKHFSECEARNIEFEAFEYMGESGPVSREGAKVLRANSRSVSDIGSGMERNTQIRIVIGLIGIILLVTGAWMLFSGSYGDSFVVWITFMVIGFIFMVIGFGVEICLDCN